MTFGYGRRSRARTGRRRSTRVKGGSLIGFPMYGVGSCCGGRRSLIRRKKRSRRIGGVPILPILGAVNTGLQMIKPATRINNAIKNNKKVPGFVKGALGFLSKLGYGSRSLRTKRGGRFIPMLPSFKPRPIAPMLRPLINRVPFHFRPMIDRRGYGSRSKRMRRASSKKIGGTWGYGADDAIVDAVIPKTYESASIPWAGIAKGAKELIKVVQPIGRLSNYVKSKHNDKWKKVPKILRRFINYAAKEGYGRRRKRRSSKKRRRTKGGNWIKNNHYDLYKAMPWAVRHGIRFVSSLAKKGSGYTSKGSKALRMSRPAKIQYAMNRNFLHG